VPESMKFGLTLWKTICVGVNSQMTEIHGKHAWNDFRFAFDVSL